MRHSQPRQGQQIVLVGANVEPLADLMVRRAALLEKLQSISASLKARGLGRTDQVVGELGECLALAVFGGTLETVSARAGHKLITG